MKDHIQYKCQDNDVILSVVFSDNEIDEVWVGIDGVDGWTVVGYTDLLKALHKADLAIVKAKRKTKE
jgi:hypothetical protein